MSPARLVFRGFLITTLLAWAAPARAGEDSALSDEPLPMQVDDIPARPRPILELGEPYLATGPLRRGIELPTGAVWKPRLLVYGTARSAYQTFDSGVRGEKTIVEWANRIDLFGELKLTTTERIVYGVRPVDDRRSFSGYRFNTDRDDDDWVNEFNTRTEALFFEGDLTELFPNLDPEDGKRLDYGFSVGRQFFIAQDGILINDVIDAVGLVRNNIFIPGTANTRATAIVGWGNVNRNDNGKDSSAQLYGLLFETDTQRSTINLDLVLVDSSEDDGDGLFGAISFAQRIGHFNTTFRVAGSRALDRDSPLVRSGALLFSEVSWTPAHSHDLVYVNLYWGIDEFSSAARDEGTGGALGRVGILFAAVGLGDYRAPLNNRPDGSFGGSIGHQMFFQGGRRQLILELGGRQDTTSRNDRSAMAAAARLQQAVGRRVVLILDGFYGRRERTGATAGVRAELRVEF